MSSTLPVGDKNRWKGKYTKDLGCQKREIQDLWHSRVTLEFSYEVNPSETFLIMTRKEPDQRPYYDEDYNNKKFWKDGHDSDKEWKWERNHHKMPGKSKAPAETGRRREEEESEDESLNDNAILDGPLNFWDIDQDGSITLDEVAKYDVDGDGKVTIEEFEDTLEKILDGEITPADGGDCRSLMGLSMCTTKGSVIVKLAIVVGIVVGVTLALTLVVYCLVVNCCCRQPTIVYAA